MKIITQNQSNEKLHFAVLRTQKLVNRNEETCSQIWRPHISKSENWFDSRTQNIFQILLNLGRFESEIGCVLGRFAPQNTSKLSYNLRKFQKNSENILLFWNPNVFSLLELEGLQIWLQFSPFRLTSF